MSVRHRIPAILAACLSSVAIAMTAFAGGSCNFVTMGTTTTEEGGDDFVEASTTAFASSPETFGILCDHHLFPRPGDTMWELSRIFLILSLTVGSLTAALAWMVASYLTPTNVNWTSISVLAAITAILQVPIFFLFEAQPCTVTTSNDVDGEGGDDGTGGTRFFSTTTTSTTAACSLGSGSYLLIASDLLYILVVVITQCLDKPRWGVELDLSWRRVSKQGESRRRRRQWRRLSNNAVVPRNDEYYYDDGENYDDAVQLRGAHAHEENTGDDAHEDREDDDYYRVSKTKQGYSTDTNQVGFFAAFVRRNLSNNEDVEVLAVETESMHEEDEQYDYEHQLLDNPLLLVRALPSRDDKINDDDDDDDKEEKKMLEPMTLKLTTDDNNNNERGTVTIRSFDGRAEDSPTTVIKQHKPTTMDGLVLERHVYINSPETSFTDNGTTNKPAPIVSVSNANDILRDLYNNVDETVGAAGVPSAKLQQSVGINDNTSNSSPVTSDAIILGVRKLTKKLKLADAKRRSRKKVLQRYLQCKGGYTPMTNDEEYEDYNEDLEQQQLDSGCVGYDDNENKDVDKHKYLNVPMENELFPDEDGFLNNNYAVGVSLKDDVDFANNKALLLESSSNLEEPALASLDDTATIPFDCFSTGSTHSDPGRLIINDAYFSDSANTSSSCDSDEDLLQMQASISDEYSTLGLDTFGDEAPMIESNSDNKINCNVIDIAKDDHSIERGRSSTTMFDGGRRKRRPISPVGSIRSSCSLLQLIINEETEEDIEKELNVPYSIKRTISAPESRSSASAYTVKTNKYTKELEDKSKNLMRYIDADNDNDNDNNNDNDDVSKSQDDIKQSGISPSERISIIATKNNDVDEHIGHHLKVLQTNLHPLDKEEVELKDMQTMSLCPSIEQGERDELQFLTKKVWHDPQRETDSKNFPQIQPRERWVEPIIPCKANINKPIDTSVDVLNETSDTEGTRSTMSDSDKSFESCDDEAGPRQIRSKSMGPRKKKKERMSHKASNSLSPSRTNHRNKLDGNVLCNRAREIRIRRMQRSNHYVPLNDECSRGKSPNQSDSATHDDSESTPKRKTIGALSNEEQDDDKDTDQDFPECLFQPNLIDQNQDCPEFDAILSTLDLQLIDLRRPDGAEYGDDEGSM